MTRDLLIPDNVESDGTLLLLAAPRSAFTTWPPKLSEVDSAVVKDITYSLTVDGWNPSKTTEDVDDARLTLREVLSDFGRTTHAVSLKYFYGSEDDIVDPLFVEGDLIVIFARYAVPYEQDTAVGDLFDIFTLKVGPKVKDIPTANGKWTKTVPLKPRTKVLEDYALTA
jgi:hypothetical protein